ncbi:MAG: CBU_0592 family membrane protein [Candidatus Pacearchaeota archaeon]
MLLTQILGWMGAGFLLLAYFLLIHHNLNSRSKLYQWMNIIGSLLLAFNTFSLRAYPSFITNILWFVVGLYGMFHAVKHFRNQQPITKRKR